MNKVKQLLIVAALEYGFRPTVAILDDLSFYLWMCELQKWLRETHLVYVVPKPVIGGKNGYDSFPVLGWDFDILANSPGSRNSYYMGYPIGEWFTAILEVDDLVEELDIPENLDYEQSMAYNLYHVISHRLKNN